MRIMATVAMAALCLFDQARAASSEQQFLEFPLATQTVAASNGAAFAWLVRQGGRTQIRYARAPKFEPQTRRPPLTAADPTREPAVWVSPLPLERLADAAARFEWRLAGEREQERPRRGF